MIDCINIVRAFKAFDASLSSAAGDKLYLSLKGLCEDETEALYA